MTTMTRTEAPTASCLPQQQEKYDHSITQAQLELFIRLGNMDDLDPNKNFTGIMNLGNALIEGNLEKIQTALRFYNSQPDLLNEHAIYLSRAFAHNGVEFLEPAFIKHEGAGGQPKLSVILSVVLDRAGKIAFISSEPNYPSYVHTFTRQKGLMMVEVATKEDPQLLLKQISRVIRIADSLPPPPLC